MSLSKADAGADTDADADAGSDEGPKTQRALLKYAHLESRRARRASRPTKTCREWADTCKKSSECCGSLRCLYGLVSSHKLCFNTFLGKDKMQ